MVHRIRLAALAALLSGLQCQLPAQAPEPREDSITRRPEIAAFERRFQLRYIKPSVLLERVTLLGATDPTQADRVSMRAEDATNMLVVRVGREAGSELERERLFLAVRDLIERFDKAEPRVRYHLYIVQTELLTDTQYRTLDGELRKGPLAGVPGGELARGVVFRRSGELRHLEIESLGEAQREWLAQTRPEPVTVTGDLLAANETSGRAYLSFDLQVVSSDRPLGGSEGAVRLRSNAPLRKGEPLIFVGGKRRPTNQSGDPFPGRHEIMMYLYAEQVETTPLVAGASRRSM